VAASFTRCSRLATRAFLSSDLWPPTSGLFFTAIKKRAVGAAPPRGGCSNGSFESPATAGLNPRGSGASTMPVVLFDCFLPGSGRAGSLIGSLSFPNL
jgi:hypothetical protein